MTRENIGNEPINSPLGRVYLCPKTEQIINCAIGLDYHIDVEAVKKAFSNSIMLKHPRFSSLVVKNSKGSVTCWERVQVDIDDHIIVHHPNTVKTRLGDEEVEAEINAFLADMSVSSPLSENKPLWEVHLLMGMKCVVLRVHHTLGDGASLMSMLNSCFGKNNNHNNKNVKKKHAKKNWRKNSILGLIQILWLTLVFGLNSLGKLLWVKDKKSVISGGDGVECWPKKMVTAKLKLQDFKCVRQFIPSATVNDVLLGAISCGLSKYLETTSPEATLQGIDVTGIVVVNLREDVGLQDTSALVGTTSASSSFWGNKTGLMLQPIHCSNGLNPLEHIKSMKAIMDQKKKSYEALSTFIFLKLLTICFPPKVASWCTYNLLCNTSLLISNIVGPSEEMVIGSNPVTFLRVNVSNVPHAITLHLVSYKGNADLQVTVAKDIIHDPELLANCIQGSVDEMKELH